MFVSGLNHKSPEQNQSTKESGAAGWRHNRFRALEHEAKRQRCKTTLAGRIPSGLKYRVFCIMET